MKISPAPIRNNLEFVLYFLIYIFLRVLNIYCFFTTYILCKKYPEFMKDAHKRYYHNFFL